MKVCLNLLIQQQLGKTLTIMFTAVKQEEETPHGKPPPRWAKLEIPIKGMCNK